MRKSSGEPKSIEAEIEASNSEEREQAEDPDVPQADASAQDATPSNEPRSADVYFCGHTTFFPLNRALQAISKEKLTGLLRSFWEQEPIDLLARDGEIILVTTRDPELYCPETPALLSDLDVVVLARARHQQRET